MQGLSWGVPVVTGDMSMGRGIVLAALCIPLAARRGALAKSDAAAAPQPAALYTDLMWDNEKRLLGKIKGLPLRTWKRKA